MQILAVKTYFLRIWGIANLRAVLPRLLRFIVGRPNETHLTIRFQAQILVLLFLFLINSILQQKDTSANPFSVS